MAVIRKPANLGCAQCPSKGSALGCAQCPMSRAAKPGNGLGFTAPELPSIDTSDWKTWALLILAGIVLYQMFFSADQRKRHSKRRAELNEARARYESQVAKIREAY